MLNLDTRSKLKGYVEGFIQALIDEHKSDQLAEDALEEAFGKKGRLKPFHKALVPPALMKVSAFERSFSTRLGSTFEEAARLIALQNHKEAKRGYKLRGQIYEGQIRQIELIRAKIERTGFVNLSFLEIIEELNQYKTGELIERANVSDLYILSNTGEEWYFELKTPQPNKDISLETTRRLLTTVALRQTTQLGVKLKAFYAMAYNPYGTRSAYKNSIAKTYLDLKNQVLLQEEFWDLLGGVGTYREVLEVYEEVGRDKGKAIFDELALGL